MFNKRIIVIVLILALGAIATIFLSEFNSVIQGEIQYRHSSTKMYLYFFFYIVALWTIYLLTKGIKKKKKEFSISYIAKVFLACFGMAGGVLISLIVITYLLIGVTGINFITSNFLLLFGLLMLASLPIVIKKLR